jgi:hypothetical protein
MRVSGICFALYGAGLCFAACKVDERPLTGLRVVIIGNAGESGSGASGGAGADTGAAPGQGGSDAGAAGGGGDTGGTSGSSGSGGTVGGAGGSSTGGAGGNPALAGGSSGGGAGGTEAAGIGGMCGCSGGAGVPGRCPDLDQNQVPDCDESLADNPSFDADVKGWRSDTDLDVEWAADDALGHDDSGSLAMTSQIEIDQDGSKLLGATQCLSVSGGSVYRFAVQISVPDDAGETRGGLELILYDTAECTGDVVDNLSSSLLKGAEWKTAELTYLTPSTARSVGLRLISIKPFRQPAVTLLFDNLLMRTD